MMCVLCVRMRRMRRVSCVENIRRPQLAALAGALLVRGTVDGAQLAALLTRQRQAASPLHAPGASPKGEQLEWRERLLGQLGAWPFLFGCVYATASWPPRDPRLPGPGEPFPSPR